MPKRTLVGSEEEVATLLTQARYVLRVREALLGSDWTVATSWTGLASVLSESRDSSRRSSLQDEVRTPLLSAVTHRWPTHVVIC